jgi:hypothetical protein
VAEADYECRPLVCVPPRENRKNCSRLQLSYILLRTPPSLALATLPHDAAGIRRPRIQPGWRLCNAIASAPGSARAEKSSAASLRLVSIRRSGTYAEQLDYLTGARAVSKGHHG